MGPFQPPWSRPEQGKSFSCPSPASPPAWPRRRPRWGALAKLCSCGGGWGQARSDLKRAKSVSCFIIWCGRKRTEGVCDCLGKGTFQMSMWFPIKILRTPVPCLVTLLKSGVSVPDLHLCLQVLPPTPHPLPPSFWHFARAGWAGCSSGAELLPSLCGLWIPFPAPHARLHA